MFRLLSIVTIAYFFQLSPSFAQSISSITCNGIGKVYSFKEPKEKFSFEVEQEIEFQNNKIVSLNTNLLGGLGNNFIEKKHTDKLYLNKDSKITNKAIKAHFFLKSNSKNLGQMRFDVSRTSGKYEFYSHARMKEDYKDNMYVYNAVGDCKKTQKKF